MTVGVQLPEASEGATRARILRRCRCPDADEAVPCHRVLAAGGKVGGFSAGGDTATNLQLLSIEGAHIGDAPTLFDTDGTFGFDPRVAVERG